MGRMGGSVRTLTSGLPPAPRGPPAGRPQSPFVKLGQRRLVSELQRQRDVAPKSLRRLPRATRRGLGPCRLTSGSP